MNEVRSVEEASALNVNKRPIASISLDLDNKWSYLKTHGVASWESFPSYLDTVVPRFLNIFDELGIKVTVFVVGQDAAIESNRNALRMITERGHEIANHSFHHEPWLHLYTPEELNREFEMAEQAIFKATGRKPIGFRGPGFSLSDQTLKVLVENGYQYDCSTFPTFLGPLARAYYFMKSSLSRKERDDRKALFGKFSDGFQSLRPFVWQHEGHQLTEIPVSTFPIIKTPVHSSYLLFLARFAPWASRSYLWLALKACRIFGVAPSFLLHPTDFLGADDESDLAFFPAMDLDSSVKVSLMRNYLESIQANFRIVPMEEHARIATRGKLGNRSIWLARSGAS